MSLSVYVWLCVSIYLFLIVCLYLSMSISVYLYLPYMCLYLSRCVCLSICVDEWCVCVCVPLSSRTGGQCGGQGKLVAPWDPGPGQLIQFDYYIHIIVITYMYHYMLILKVFIYANGFTDDYILYVTVVRLINLIIIDAKMFFLNLFLYTLVNWTVQILINV